MDNLISIRQAALLAGKSEKTIKRWVIEGKLKDRRTLGSKGTPIVLNETEVSTISPEPSKDMEVYQERTRKDTEDKDLLVKALYEQINDLREQIKTLKEILQRVQEEKERVQYELEESRKMQREMDKELIARKGVRGLLKAFWPIRQIKI